MTDFLLELRSEEIPARMQAKAREDLRFAFETAIRAEGSLHQGEVTTYSTPRRLTLIARGLADHTEAEHEEFKGPKVGAPEQAVLGFAKKIGVSLDEIFQKLDAKGVLTYYAQVSRPARSTIDVLSVIIPNIIRTFPWPKSMRWGAASASTESLRWVRPLQGIVALFGEAVVPVEIAGIASGATTAGHRFHHPDAVTIRSAADYVETLRDAHVIVDQDERAAIIATGAAMATAKAGLTLVRDEGLLAENAGLTEWPMPLLGRFDPDYLSVPPEVIQLTARVNQKYFVCRDADGKLANAFVCTANIDADDGGAKIVEGNRKVLAARLSDARFFYDTDLKVPLQEQAKKLDRIVFHEKLGTVADKVERVAKLARWLVEEGLVPPPHPSAASGGSLPLPQGEREKLADLAERAARLAKADLVTGMVGEFPELQGLMGGYYAAAQGEPELTATAIRDHYRPSGQGDWIPADPVTVAVSIADKLDTIAAFFAIGEKPTGSKDPFALRRAAIGFNLMSQGSRLRLPIRRAFAILYVAWVEAALVDARKDAILSLGEAEFWEARAGNLQTRLFDEYLEFAPVDVGHKFIERFCRWNTEAADEIVEFLADRLKVQQREAGVRHDLIDAVFALGGEDDLVRLLARVHALQAFVGTDDGANLLAGYKRAANILKKEGVTTDVTPAKAGASGEGAGQEPREAPASAGATYDREPAEAALIAALDAAEPAAADAVAREDFAGAMAALATLRAPIDAFFEAVTVNDADPAKRAARLALLLRVRDAVHGVADFSRVEG